MAAKKRSRPGYEPAKGFPDPESEERAPLPAGVMTHRPGASGGPACPPYTRGGVVPTDPQAYIDIFDPKAMPTCPWCARYHAAVRDSTRALVPGA